MPDFTFNKRTRTYSRDGRPVKSETLRLWVSEILEGARGQMKEVTEEFTAGTINRAAWTLQMRQLISRSHGAMWMLAQGGKDAMDSKAWGAAGQKIRSEADFLRGFERAIANGEAGTDAQVVARAQLYANGLHASYQAAVVARERAAGAKRVLRVLGTPQTEHCNDCESLAGEYDIESVPQIGDTECGPACLCEIIPVELGVAA